MRTFMIQPDLSLYELEDYFGKLSGNKGWITKRSAERIKLVMEMAKIWANNSTCPKGKRHACIILYYNKYIIGMGYNGPPSRMEPCKECVYASSKDNVNFNECPAVHSEVNAVINMNGQTFLTRSPKIGGMAVVTKTPCKHCRAVLLNAGISTVTVNEVKENGHSK